MMRRVRAENGRREGLDVTIRLDPGSYYDGWTLQIMGIDGDTLEAAREAGHLRCRELGEITLYKGEWVLEWLDQADPEPAGGGRARR
jgi:hypothetical protein